MKKESAGGFKGRDVLSISDFSKDDILHVLATAKKMEAMNPAKKALLLKNKIMGSLFFEPSTRTRLSFNTSMERLGGRVVGFADPSSTSGAKGESLWDTIKMVEQYVDVIVMRHPLEGSARLASEATEKPIINGGDGANQHPTQTLLDLYTIQQCQKKIDGLKIAMVGDLKYGRTVHSLTTALSLFNTKLYFVAPDSLKMPRLYFKILDKEGIPYEETDKVEDVLDEVDILYSTRIQKERFPDIMEYEKVKNVYILKKAMLQNVKKNLRIMHPLPRVNEIKKDVDELPYAYYFQQAGNGIPVRQALLSLVLGAVK